MVNFKLLNVIYSVLTGLAVSLLALVEVLGRFAASRRLISASSCDPNVAEALAVSPCEAEAAAIE